MVSMRPTLLLSDNLSSNPTKDFNFAVKNVDEKNENKQKNAGVGPLKIIDQICFYLLQELVQDQNSSFSFFTIRVQCIPGKFGGRRRIRESKKCWC